MEPVIATFTYWGDDSVGGTSLSGMVQISALSAQLEDEKESSLDALRRLQRALMSNEQLEEQLTEFKTYQLRYKLSEEELSDLEFENAMLRQKIRDNYQDLETASVVTPPFP